MCSAFLSELQDDCACGLLTQCNPCRQVKCSCKNPKNSRQPPTLRHADCSTPLEEPVAPVGCAVGPEAKSELSREERKMQQQLELFKKMEAATQKDEAGGGGRGGKANASEKTAGQRVGAAKERKTADVDREEVSGASSDEEEGKQGRMRMGKGSKSRREDARRVSRVKGSHGSGNKSEAPDLEAHFSDGAWYDIVLRTADSSSNRFLVQVRFDHQPRPCARIHAARFQILRGRRRTRGPAPSYRAASW